MVQSRLRRLHEMQVLDAPRLYIILAFRLDLVEYQMLFPSPRFFNIHLVEIPEFPTQRGLLRRR
jgi:hypothetical protein